MATALKEVSDLGQVRTPGDTRAFYAHTVHTILWGGRQVLSGQFPLQKPTFTLDLWVLMLLPFPNEALKVVRQG